jgi:hypothetical protein
MLVPKLPHQPSLITNITMFLLHHLVSIHIYLQAMDCAYPLAIHHILVMCRAKHQMYQFHASRLWRRKRPLASKGFER